MKFLLDSGPFRVFKPGSTTVLSFLASGFFAFAKANRQAYLAKLLQQNPVAVNELALSKVLNK